MNSQSPPKTDNLLQLTFPLQFITLEDLLREKEQNPERLCSSAGGNVSNPTPIELERKSHSTPCLFDCCSMPSRWKDSNVISNQARFKTREIRFPDGSSVVVPVMDFGDGDNDEQDSQPQKEKLSEREQMEAFERNKKRFEELLKVYGCGEKEKAKDLETGSGYKMVEEENRIKLTFHSEGKESVKEFEKGKHGELTECGETQPQVENPRGNLLSQLLQENENPNPGKPPKTSTGVPPQSPKQDSWNVQQFVENRVQSYLKTLTYIKPKPNLNEQLNRPLEIIEKTATVQQSPIQTIPVPRARRVIRIIPNSQFAPASTSAFSPVGPRPLHTTRMPRPVYMNQDQVKYRVAPRMQVISGPQEGLHESPPKRIRYIGPTTNVSTAPTTYRYQQQQSQNHPQHQYQYSVRNPNLNQNFAPGHQGHNLKIPPVRPIPVHTQGGPRQIIRYSNPAPAQVSMPEKPQIVVNQAPPPYTHVDIDEDSDNDTHNERLLHYWEIYQKKGLDFEQLAEYYDKYHFYPWDILTARDEALLRQHIKMSHSQREYSKSEVEQPKRVHTLPSQAPPPPIPVPVERFAGSYPKPNVGGRPPLNYSSQQVQHQRLQYQQVRQYGGMQQRAQPQPVQMPPQFRVPTGQYQFRGNSNVNVAYNGSVGVQRVQQVPQQHYAQGPNYVAYRNATCGTTGARVQSGAVPTSVIRRVQQVPVSHQLG